MLFKKCSCGVEILGFGEAKGVRLPLAKSSYI